MTNIENLRKEVSEVEVSLNELKGNIGKISEDDKNKQSEELTNKVETVKKMINDRIRELSEKKDGSSKKELEEAKQLLESLDKFVGLQHDIIKGKKNSFKDYTTQKVVGNMEGGSQSIVSGAQRQQEEKGLLGKTWDRTKDQWNDVFDKEKRKEEGGKNLLRTVGFAATGAGAIALAYKGAKKLWNRAFGSKEEERSSENKKTSWRKKVLLWLGITAGTTVGGVELYKNWNKVSSWVKDRLGLSLSFNESKNKVESDIRNGKIDNGRSGEFNANFDGGITYEEDTQELCSYGQKTKISENGKKIEGVGVEFASREDLIHAINIVNYTKMKLKGKGSNATPFSKSKEGKGIDFNHSGKGQEEFMSAGNSKEGSWILGAYIDKNSSAEHACKTIRRGRNLDKFIDYLNNQVDENGESLRVSGVK